MCYKFVSEPIGSVGPRVSGDRLQEHTMNSGDSFAILCQAQAYPMPAFRY